MAINDYVVISWDLNGGRGMRKTTKDLIQDNRDCKVDLTQGSSRIRSSNSEHSAMKFDNAI
jgi:hypothetical protein